MESGSGRGTRTGGRSRGIAERKDRVRTPKPPGETLGPAVGASRTGVGRRGPGLRGRPGHGPRPPGPGGGGGRGARLRSLSGVQALADSARSRPERKAAVTVTR